MDLYVFARASVLQALVVGAAFVLLIAAPLPDTFFRDYGLVAGPGAWLVCSAITARLLHLSVATGALAGLAGGAAAVLVGLVSHNVGVVAGVLAFGATVAATVSRRRRGASLRR